MAKRKAISKGVRFEIFKRDSFTCQYCGRTPPTVMLQIDHITPVAKGGDNNNLNLITACQDCNIGKTDRELSMVPPPLKSQMEEQRERREQVDQYNDFLMGLRSKQTGDIEEIGSYWYNKIEKEKNKFVFGPARQPTIRTFLKSLPKAEILDAIDAAYARFPVFGHEFDGRTFRYFCGICWRKIRGPAE